ncbi:unnamed protein product [Closterium sp. NIES-64]|nr:unnamed protein product [Closterium sp. NIES-64]
MKKNIDIYALDFDAILTAMYVASTSGEGAQYLRVPPDPGIRTSEATALCASASVALGAGEATALGARESAPPGTESTEALHTFTLDSGASHCFFRDRTALEQLARPVAVSPADPSGGPGRQRAAPHSSSFPPTTAPLQTLHMDVWGPAPVRGQGQERYFLIVVDDYSRYTTVFPLRTKGEVPDVLIPWIRASHLQLSERFHSDFPVLRLHSDRGGEFSSDLLAAYCAEHGIRQSFTLPASPQQNGVAGAALACSTSGPVSPCRRLPRHCVGRRGAAVVDPFPPQGAAPSGMSQADPVEPVEVAVDSCPARGAEPERAEPERAEPGGADLGGAEPGGAEPGGTEPGGAESGGAAPGGAEPGCAMSEGAEAERASPGGALSSQELREWRELPSPQRLREWYTRQCSLRSYAPSAADPSAGDAAAVGGAAGAGAARGAAAGATRGAPGAGAAGAAGGTATTGGAAGAAGAAGGAAAAGSAAGAAGGAAGAGAAGAAGAAGPGGARTGV